MPWCEECAKFWTPTSMPPDGSCPTCGALIGDPPDDRVPWHFWVLVAALVIYLGWRLVQLFGWLIENGNTPVALGLGVLLVVVGAWGGWAWTRARAARREEEAEASSDRRQHPRGDAPGGPVGPEASDT